MQRGFAFSIAALLLLWLPGLSFAQVSVEGRLAEGLPPLVIAHRSAVLGGHPENTLAWVEHGIERGVDMLHINPQLTADGNYVLMHDQTLNRMTDVERVYPDGPPGGPTRAQRGGLDFVRDYTLEEIRRLQIADGEDGGAHPVPSLSEAIEQVGGRTLLLLGLKSYDIQGLASILRQHESQNLMIYELYYSGTDQSRLRELAELSGVPVGVSLFRSTDYLADLEGIRDQLGPHLRMLTVGARGLTPEFLSRVDELGLHLAISGWRTGEDYALIEDLNPDPWQTVLDSGHSISTDQPDAVLQLLGR